MISQYEGTEGGGALTAEQRQFYVTNGYLLLENLIPHNILDAGRERFLDLCSGRGPGFPTVVQVLDSEGADVKKIQDFVHDDVLYKYISAEALTNVVQSIIGPNITAVHSMFINEPPAAKSDDFYLPLHQDLYFLPIRPASSIVGVLTAVDKMDKESGCLNIVPGSHKGKLNGHDHPEESGEKFHGVQGLEDVPKAELVMEKGDTVLFHPLLLHGFGPNMSKGPRRGISCHYAGSSCSFVKGAPKTDTTQKPIAEEFKESVASRGFMLDLQALTKRKNSPDLSNYPDPSALDPALYPSDVPVTPYNPSRPQDIFMLKSRLVVGSPGTLQFLGSRL